MRGIFQIPLIAFLILGGAAQAAPPVLDVAPAFGDSFIPQRWQTINVTVANPDNGDIIQGEIQVAIENSQTNQREAAFARAVALPKGAGAARVPVTIYFPEMGGAAKIHLYLVAAADKGGGVITQREFEHLPIRRNDRTILAVTAVPDALAYLDGKTFDETPPAARRDRPPPKPLRIARAADAGTLPDRAAGYDAAQIVYLSPDISPAAFSDAQADALRGYVAGGGLLIVSGARLREDERFRPWVPPLASEGEGRRDVGGGRMIVVAADLAAPRFAASPEAMALWNRFVNRETPPASVGRIAADDSGYGYNNFCNSVLYVPGLAGPGVWAIAGFLVSYLLLLVPVNYFVLKRLDRREWAWVTVPALAALFSLGAYGFSYATKGRQVRVNVASVAEMGAGSGDAQIHAAVGVFSPARARFDVGVDAPDAVMWEPSLGFGRGGASGASPLFIEREAGGSVARNVAVPMWGVGVVAARTSAVKLGDGVTVTCARRGSRFSGAVTNRTGRALSNVVIRLGAFGKRLGDVAAGQTVPFAFLKSQENRISQETGFEAEPDYREASSPALTRRQIAADLSRGAYEGVNFETADARLYLTAWTYDRLLPVTIDGKTIGNGENVSLLIVTAPKP